MRYANAAGTVIINDDNVFVPVDPENMDYQAILASNAAIEPYSRFAGHTIEAAKSALIGEVDRVASERRIAIAGTSDPTKLSVYTEKYQIAKRALEGDQGAIDTLSPEAAARGETWQSLAALVIGLGDEWRRQSFIIEAKAASHKAAIAALSDLAGLSGYDVNGGWGR